MISTLLELQRLKRLERTGWTLRGLASGAESVAAHSFGVAVVAMMLADEVRARGVEVDVERLLRVALMHDWAEGRLGDMPRTGSAYFSAEARRRAERAAFDDMTCELGAGRGALYSELHEDYEARGSLEARLVKAADVIDLLLQALSFERGGARGLDEFWEGIEGRYFQLDGVAGDVVNEALQELIETRAEIKTENKM
jgi:putative hydrolase of HD superfamily